MKRLLAFYRGLEPDSRGRRLADILRQDDAWLEARHDFVQWLFPLREPSGASPSVPLLDPETERIFRDDPLLQDRLRAAFRRLLSFYGLQWTDGAVEPAPNWSARKANWFIRPTHNNLRITRMLRSLRLLGLEVEALAFHRALERLCETESDAGVGEVARAYWREAIEAPHERP